MKYPEPLQKGDKIAVTAFSSGVPSGCHQRLDLVLEHLRSLGFNVIEGHCLRENEKHVSATPSMRAEELMKFLCDDSISAVAPPWGGEFAMDLLPLLDFEKLKQVKPKWVFGFSDVSTISSVLTTQLGWSTLHSSNLMELNPLEKDELTANTLNVMTAKAGAEITQFSSDLYQVSGESFETNPNCCLVKTERTQWKAVGEVEESSFSGRLIGGCFDTMVHLIGTEYLDLERFKQCYPNDGLILYLENAEMPPTVLKRALQGLKYQGVFEQISGLLFGRNAVLDNCGKAITSSEAFLSVANDLKVPVLYDVDIGHLPPNLALFNGAHAEVHFKDGKGKIVQTLR